MATCVTASPLICVSGPLNRGPGGVRIVVPCDQTSNIKVPKFTGNRPALSGWITITLFAVIAVIAVVGISGLTLAQDAGKMSKFLLMKMSRDQSEVLCKSEAFTSCMGFTAQACLELSEKALEQCIMPLPDTILLQDLNSEVLESCPQQIYSEAGLSNEKAAECLQEVLKN